MHWVVIPFRGFESAKSRLAGRLSDEARRHISRAMFQHVLNVACQAAGPKNVLVVTPSSTATRIARISGAAILRDKEPGLNAAVTSACSFLRGRGKATAAIVASDLPLLLPDDVHALTQRARDGFVGIARDRSGKGTNAVSLPLGVPFQFKFGEHSFYQHFKQGRTGAFAVTTLRRRGLAADVDVPDDLALLDEEGALASLPVARNIQFRMP